MPTTIELREKFEQDILENRVVPDALWNKKCEGYNIQVLLKDLQGIDQFAECQNNIWVGESENLYQCPISSLHISIAWIVAVQQNYSRDRNQIWMECKTVVLDQLKDLAINFRRFRVRYTGLVATDTAVIAVGEDDGTIAKIREEIARNVDIPPETTNGSNIIHTTLFRYRNNLSNPSEFLRKVNKFPLDVSFDIDHLAVEQELVYPSIVSKNAHCSFLT